MIHKHHATKSLKANPQGQRSEGESKNTIIELLNSQEREWSERERRTFHNLWAKKGRIVQLEKEEDILDKAQMR